MSKLFYVFHDDELISEATSFLSVINVIFDSYQLDTSGEYWFLEVV